MAHFSIISSQSGQEIFEGAPRYVGAYLKPGYLEFSEIGSPAAIDWHVGDYIVYSRTGKTYRLYRTPQTVEQGNAQRYGAAFLYENVQFFDDSKQLEFCPFTDLVPGDNTIHFSTQNTVSFFGKPLNVAERLQACLEAQYGPGSWAVRIVSTTDADLLELLDTEVEFSVSGANCQQVLDKVYELWNGLGWIHTVENGVNVITIGASNVRTSSNTTVPFAYDNGLVRVERSIANADRIGTRLYAYGSMKNMDATYYRGLNIKDAESVDIEHLMIPLSSWGLTDGLPDARKAYIEDASAIASLGLIPRTAYFDGTGDLPDIFPTIERMTIGEVYDAGGAGYLPDLNKWARSQRIDEVVSASNPSDHGTSAEQGQKYAENFSSTLGAVSESFIDHDWLHATIYSATLAHGGKLTLRFGSNRQVFTLDSAWGPTFDLRLTITAGTKTQEIPLTVVSVSDTSYYTVLPETVTLTGTTAGALEVKVDGYIGQENDSTAQGGEGTFTSDPATTISGGVEYELDKTFSLIIPQIGFDIDNYADLGNGKTISMKTGMCAGRDFEIKDATYNSSSDSWQLTLYRSVDEDLNIMFPNADYQIAAGDQYVLLDIAMPEMYVTVASQRLLAAAQRLLADISVEQPFYAPQIDAKVVYNEGRVLREGMWMDVTFDSAQEYVLIDSITIDENGSNIPTYEVALREKKGLDWTENVGSSSSSRSSSSVNGSDQQQAAGTVTSVGMTVPDGMEVSGSPINSAGILSLQLKQGYIIPRVEDLGAYFQQNASLSTLVELKSSYSYLGVKNGIFFSGATEADFEVQTINGQRVIHSRLPFYSDSFISAGGISDGGGSAGGNATLVAQTYGGTLSATGINPINFYSKERVDQLIATAGTVQTVAGISPVSGDIPVASLQSALGLGAAAYKAIGSVASGNTGLVTGGSVYSAINEAVSSVLKMQGTTTTAISDGSTTNPVVIDGSSYTAKKGDVVMYGNKEFWWTGSAWEELGDEASWALKTTTISAGTGLTGGGSLASNRTISLSQATIDSLALADTALQAHQAIYSLTIKNSAGTTQLTYTPNDEAASITLTKAMVGLGNVENTALSTWAGTNKITTVGTIATGTWQGTAIGYNYVAAHYIGRTRTTASAANATLLGIDAISNASSSGSSDKSRIVWDSTNNAWHFLGNVYADGFVSAGGLSSGGGSEGVSLAAVWASLKTNSDDYANEKINAYHIPIGSGLSVVNGLIVANNAGTVTSVKVGTTTYNPTDGVVSLPAYPTYSRGTAITISNSTISVAGTVDSEAISFDPDTHSGADASNPVAWGSASGTYGIKLSVNNVTKDLVLVSGYNALASRVTALENAPEGGITTIGTYQGAVTLGSNLSITENGVLSAVDTTYGVATTSAAGLMSADDKSKLNGIASGATNVTDSTVSGWGYIKSSSLPGYASSDTAGIIKIGSGLTISDEGVVSVTGQTQGTVTRVDVGTSQYSPSSAGVVSLPAYPTIPTNVSAFSNDAGYLTAHQSLDGYVNDLTRTPTSGGNYVASVTKSGKTITVTYATLPTALKNPNALTFGSKTYDGSEAKTITASDLGALTSHQTVTLASGTNNGTLKLTVGSTTTDNIAVKGLGSMAYASTADYVKLNPGAAEQTIRSSISSLVDGVVTLWRNSGDHYTFLGFSNGTTETYLGGIGFKSQSDHNLYRKDGSNYYKILDENNYTSFVNTTNFPGLNGNQTITLSGDVSGSGATSIAVSIGTGKVTNAMLAGSIENSKLNTIGVAKGGTGLTTWTGAYRLIYSSAATTVTTLAPNTAATRKFLRMLGTGSAGAAPAWDTVTKTDVGLSNVPNWVYTITDSSTQTFTA